MSSGYGVEGRSNFYEKFYDSLSNASNYMTKRSIYRMAKNSTTNVNGRINDLIARHPKRATITALALAALTISLLVAGIHFKCTPFYVATAITASITAICLKKLHAHQLQRVKQDSYLTDDNLDDDDLDLDDDDLGLDLEEVDGRKVKDGNDLLSKASKTETSIYKMAANFITNVNGRINDLTARRPKRATITALALAALTISLLAAGIYFKCTPFYVATAITASITAICLKKLHAHQQQPLTDVGRERPWGDL